MPAPADHGHQDGDCRDSGEGQEHPHPGHDRKAHADDHRQPCRQEQGHAVRGIVASADNQPLVDIRACTVQAFAGLLHEDQRQGGVAAADGGSGRNHGIPHALAVHLGAVGTVQIDNGDGSVGDHQAGVDARKVGVGDEYVGIAAADGVRTPAEGHNCSRAGTAVDGQGQRGWRLGGALPGPACRQIRAIDECGPVDQRRLPEGERTDIPAVDAHGARPKGAGQRCLQFSTRGPGWTLNGQLHRRFLQSCARAPNERAVQRHGVEVLTVSLSPN